jgi:uncharacterized coiled-coil protein SlyX
MEDRVVDLEIKLAYQDKKTGELEDLVRAMAFRLDTVERELADLKRSLAPEERIDDRPPHY